MSNKIPGVGVHNFFYDQQIKRLFVQFMAIFVGLQVQSSVYDKRESGLIPVPVFHGRPDRVVAAIKSGNTRNRPIALPCMSAYIESYNLAPNLQTGVGITQRQTVTPLGGVVPNDTKVIRQMNPIAYQLRMTLTICTSNTEQLHQLLEQILLIFAQPVQLQTSDGYFDRSAVTSCELIDIRNENNFPVGYDEKINAVTLTFETVLYLTAPVTVRDDFIKKINLRIGMVSNAAFESGQIVEELDALGIDYQEIVDITKESY